MKDYIVFFTQGFDKYTEEKQKKVFPNAYISCIDSLPDYNRLVLESKIAKEKNYDNFYILWEKDDVPDMSSEMKKEFSDFNETAAIPYKYNKLIEADTSAPAATNAPVSQPAVPVNQPATVSPINNNPVTETPTTQAAPAPKTADVVVNDTLRAGNNLMPNETNSSNSTGISSAGGVTYTKDHQASIYIWPFNLFSAHTSTTAASLNALGREMRLDSLARIPAATVQANTNNTKKGNWQRILYIPQSLKEMHQGVARGDDMWFFTNDTFQAEPFVSHSEAGKNFINFIKRDISVGGTKLQFGPLTQQGILNACSVAGATSATKSNIHVFFTAPYEKYFDWMNPANKSIMSLGGHNTPDIQQNDNCMKLLKSMTDNCDALLNNQNSKFKVEYISEIINNPEYADIKQQYADMLGVLNLVYFNPLWEYLKLYKLQNDIYGVPSGRGTQDKSSLSDGWSDALAKLEKLFSNRHTNDLDWLKRMANMLPRDLTSEDTKLSNQFAKLKQKAQDAKEAAAAIGNAARDTKNKVSNITKKANGKENSNGSFDYDDEEKIEELRQDADKKAKGQKDEDKKDSENEKKEESLVLSWLESRLQEADIKAAGETKVADKDANSDSSTDKDDDSEHDASEENASQDKSNDEWLLNPENTIHFMYALTPEWETFVKNQFYSKRVYAAFEKAPKDKPGTMKNGKPVVDNTITGRAARFWNEYFPAVAKGMAEAKFNKDHKQNPSDNPKPENQKNNTIDVDNSSEKEEKSDDEYLNGNT